MRQYLLIPVCFISLLVPVAVLASGGEGGFNGVVHSIESRYHAHATRIPFLGLISMISNRATSGGVSNLHVAEFEHFSATMDGEELNQMIGQKLGEGWERVIRETSRDGADQTLVFMRPEGEKMGLFVLDADGNELDVVQVSVDPNHLNENLDRYDHHHRHHDDAGDDSN